MANVEDRKRTHIKYAVAIIIIAVSLYDIHYTPKTVAYSTDVIVLYGIIFYLVFSGIRRIRILPVRAFVVALTMGFVYYFRPIQWSTVAIFSLAALF